MSFYYTSSYLISFYSYIFLLLYLSTLISSYSYIFLPLSLSILISLTFYSYLSYILYRISLLLFIRGFLLSFSIYLYINCLSFYSYGGYPSYLLSIWTVFLSIRTGAISSTYFLYELIFLYIRTGANPPTYFRPGLSTLFMLLLSNLYSNTYSK
jgi:hypothetical protein